MHRCLIHLSQPDRSEISSNPEKSVLADAQALLTSYTVGVDFHSVVELGYTSSINFLLPGMLLKVRIVYVQWTVCMILDAAKPH